MSCVCGHAEEEHGNDLKYPRSDACTGVTNNGKGTDVPCECLGYEEDEGEGDEP